MTDIPTLDRWLTSYVEAWTSNDPDLIGALFTDAATYRWHPYDEGESVAHGREAIVRAWLEEPDTPGSWEMSFEPLAVTGDVGVARCVTTYPGGDAGERIYHNVFVVRLDDEGRCFDFTEYFMRAPGTSAANA